MLCVTQLVPQLCVTAVPDVPGLSQCHRQSHVTPTRCDEQLTDIVCGRVTQLTTTGIRTSFSFSTAFLVLVHDYSDPNISAYFNHPSFATESLEEKISVRPSLLTVIVFGY